MSEERQFWERVHEVYPTKTMQMTFTDDPATAEGEAARVLSELLALVPELPKGAKIIELAAGFGRFTTHLAALGSVVAYDFVERFCAENQARDLPNVEIRQADVLEAELPKGVDLVFWSWLLQLVADEAATEMLHKVVASLRPGGRLVFRESCAEPACFWEGPPPTRYRQAAWYLERLRAEPLAGIEVVSLKTWDDQRVFFATASTSVSF
jgi:phosphoethanolamine N-methyltransferase